MLETASYFQSPNSRHRRDLTSALCDHLSTVEQNETKIDVDLDIVPSPDVKKIALNFNIAFADGSECTFKHPYTRKPFGFQHVDICDNGEAYSSIGGEMKQNIKKPV